MVVCRGGRPMPAAATPLSLFIVPADAPGITRTRSPTALHVPETSFTLFFDDVQVGRALVGQEGHGLQHLFAGLNPERVCAAAINNGIAALRARAGARQARDRRSGANHRRHQGIAHPLAKAYIAVQQARLMTPRAPRSSRPGLGRCRRGRQHGEVRRRRRLAGGLDQTIRAHGGNGLAIEYGLADLWFIARLHKTAR